MAVQKKYYSDKDPKNMFTEKSEADAHDRKLTAIEELSVVLMDSTKSSGIALVEDDAYKLAEAMISDHASEMLTIITGKKPRKPRQSKPPAGEKTTGDSSGGTPGAQSKAA